MCLGNGIYDLGSHKGSKSSFREMLEMLEIRLFSYSFFSPTVTTPWFVNSMIIEGITIEGISFYLLLLRHFSVVVFEVVKG